MTLSIVVRRYPDAAELRRIDIPVTIPMDFFANPGRMPTIRFLIQGGGQYTESLFGGMLEGVFSIEGMFPMWQTQSRSLKDLIAKINSLNLPTDTIFVREILPPLPKEKGSSEQKQAEDVVWRKILSSSAEAANGNAENKEEVSQFSVPPIEGVVNLNVQLSISVSVKPPAPTAQETKQEPPPKKKSFWRKLLPF